MASCRNILGQFPVELSHHESRGDLRTGIELSSLIPRLVGRTAPRWRFPWSYRSSRASLTPSPTPAALRHPGLVVLVVRVMRGGACAPPTEVEVPPKVQVRAMSTELYTTVDN